MNKYFYELRPPFIGTEPKGFADREAFDFREKKQVGKFTVRAHGSVTYPKPLEFEKIYKFDLFPADEVQAERFHEWRTERNR